MITWQRRPLQSFQLAKKFKKHLVFKRKHSLQKYQITLTLPFLCVSTVLLSIKLPILPIKTKTSCFLTHCQGVVCSGSTSCLIPHLTHTVYLLHTVKALLQPLQYNPTFLALFCVQQVVGQPGHEPAQTREDLSTHSTALVFDLEEVDVLWKSRMWFFRQGWWHDTQVRHSWGWNHSSVKPIILVI